MPTRLPNNLVVTDQPVVLCNNRWTGNLTIMVTYRVRFWTWLWRALLRRYPLYVNVISGNSGQIIVNGDEVKCR